MTEKSSRLNLQAVAHIAEVIGAIVIVVTLAIVYQELHLTKQALRSSSNIQLLGLSFEIRSDVARDPELAEFLEKATAGLDTLSAAEQRRYNAYIGRVFDVWEQAYFSSEDAFIDGQLWTAWDCAYRSLFGEANPNAPLDYWNAQRSGYAPVFQAYVDAIIEDGERLSNCR